MRAVGEEARLRSVLGDTGVLIFAIDHNFNPITAKSGTADIPSHLRLAGACGINVMLAHLDVLDDPANKDIQVAGMRTILQVNALHPDENSRAMVSDPDSIIRHAVRIDAKMLGIQIDFGSDYEGQSLQDLKSTRHASSDLDLPLFVHTYLRSGDYAFEDLSVTEYGDRINAAIETVRSLGGSVVKIAFRDPDTFGRAVETAHDLGLRILAAGGKKTSMGELLENAVMAMQLGADGVTVGRNAFERPIGNTEPTLDIAVFGSLPATLGGIDMPPGHFEVPDDEITALLALRAITHREVTNVSDALLKALTGRHLI